MKTQKELKLDAIVDKLIYLNRKTLYRIQEIYNLKSSSHSLKYVVKCGNKVIDTYEEFKQFIQNMNLRCMLSLSQPFKPEWNTFVYYVTFTPYFDYGNTIKDCDLRILFALRKKAFIETRIAKVEIPKGWQYQKRN